MPMLEIKGLSKRFGGLTALSGLSLDVNTSEILGIIGPNGAGKTTLFEIISGFHRPSEGIISFQEQRIDGLRPDQIARRGISRNFQHSTLYMESTALENVFAGMHMGYRMGVLPHFLGLPRARKEERDLRQKAIEILEYMGLSGQAGEKAKNLPHGHQRILGISVALAARPVLLLLDEPLTGMNPTETDETVRLIRQLRGSGMTIMLVEHDMRAVMSLCDQVIVLNFGIKIAEGPPLEVTRSREVIEAYLGRGKA